jgi:hypothetical protein
MKKCPRTLRVFLVPFYVLRDFVPYVLLKLPELLLEASS